MGPLPRSRERAVRRGARAPRSAPADRRLPARRARPRRRPRADRSRHAHAAGGSARREPSHPDPARRLPDRRRDARRARGRRRAHPHPSGVRALGAAQPGLLTPDAPAGSGGPGGARRPGGVPARAPDRYGAREPRGPDERTDAPRGAVPRAAEHLGGGAGRRHRGDRGAHPAAAVAPLHLANHPRGAPRGVARGSSAARPACPSSCSCCPSASSRSSSSEAGRSRRPARARSTRSSCWRRPCCCSPHRSWSLRLLLFVFRRIDSRIGRIEAPTRLPGGAQAQSLPRAPGSPPRCCCCSRWVCSSSRPRTARSCCGTTRTRRTRIVGADWNVHVTPPDDVLSGDRRHAAEHDAGRAHRAATSTRARTPCHPSRSRSTPPPTPPADGGDRTSRRRRSTEILDGIEDLRPRDRPPGGRDARSRCRSTSRRPPCGIGVTATVSTTSGVTPTPRRSSRSRPGPRPTIPLTPGTTAALHHVPGGHAPDLPFRFTIAIIERGHRRRAAAAGRLGPADVAGQRRASSTPAGDRYRFDMQLGAATCSAASSRSRSRCPRSCPPTSPPRSTYVHRDARRPGHRARSGGRGLPVPATIPNAPFIVVPARALLEREPPSPSRASSLNEVWAEGDGTPLRRSAGAGLHPGARRPRTAPIEGFLAQLPQSLAARHELRRGGRRRRPGGRRRRGGAVLRPAPPRLRVRRAPGDGRRVPQIVRTLALEQGLLLGFAVVAGLGLGYLLLRLMMPYVGPSLRCVVSAARCS